MGDTATRRKKIYVSRLIQGGMLAKLTLYWCVYHLVLWHAMFLFRYVEYREELFAGGEAVPFTTFYSEFASQHFSLIICALAVFPIVFWDMMRVTHRIAGPLVRFQHTFRQLTRGEKVSPIVLRKGDLLVELQDTVNDYLVANGHLEGEPTAASNASPPGSDQSENEDGLVLNTIQEIGEVVGSTTGIGRGDA